MIKLQRRLLFVYRMKFKFGEYVGLSRLRSRDLDDMLPHLSLPMPNDWDHEDKRKLSLDECQSKFADRLSKHLRKRPAVIDSHRFDEDEEFKTASPHPIREFAERARLLGCCIIPAITVEPSGALTVAVREIVRRNQSGIVLKLSLGDLEDSRLGEKVDTVLGGVGISAKDAMLCIDLGEFEIEKPEDVAEALSFQIAAVPYLQDWAHVYITVGTFSTQMAKIGFNSTKSIERGEWELYRALMSRSDLPRRVVYADYGIENPNFLRNPQNARASAHFRYTLDKGGIVSKGGSIANMSFAAIRAAAKNIVDHPEYSGPAYSFGDAFIKKVSDGLAVGNPSYWRAAGVAHHATKTLEQVRLMFGVTVRESQAETQKQEELF